VLPHCVIPSVTILHKGYYSHLPSADIAVLALFIYHDYVSL